VPYAQSGPPAPYYPPQQQMQAYPPTSDYTSIYDPPPMYQQQNYYGPSPYAPLAVAQPFAPAGAAVPYPPYGPPVPYAQSGPPAPYYPPQQQMAMVQQPALRVQVAPGTPTQFYQVKQCLGSLTGNMDVKDDKGKVVYKFKGKWISFMDCVRVKDMRQGRGKAIGVLREKVTAKKMINKPRYVIEINGQKATVNKDVLSFIKDNFTIKLRGQPPIQVQGDWLSWEFKFWQGNALIAVISKRFVHLTDNYGVQIYPSGVDPAIIIACCVVIDRVCFGELTHKGFVNSSSHLPQNPFSRFPVSHASW